MVCDIFVNVILDMEEDVIVFQDNGWLLGVVMGCVKVIGECVVKIKWVIERIGDFEFEFDNGSLGVNFDFLVLMLVWEEKDFKYCLFELVSIVGLIVFEILMVLIVIFVIFLVFVLFVVFLIDKLFFDVLQVILLIIEQLVLYFLFLDL